MTVTFKPNDRAAQILRALASHGSLTVSGLHAIIEPTMHPQRLRESLSRLHKKRVLKRLYDRQFGNAAVYHQIDQSESARSFAARLLGVSPDTLKQPHFRHMVLLHSQACAVWSERLRRLLPEVKMLREHEFASEPSIEGRLQAGKRDFDLLPDIVLIGGKYAGRRPVIVAVEIERTFKSEGRLFRKLKKYAAQSSLDGVIYICPHGIGERLNAIYNAKVLEGSPRIGHYSKHFVLYVNGNPPAPTAPISAINAAGSPVSIKTWMQHLLFVPDKDRRDKNFAEPVNGYWPISPLNGESEKTKTNAI